MGKYKVGKSHDGKWYVFRKFMINGSGSFRWVVISMGHATRSDAVVELSSGANEEDTLTLTT